MCWLVDGWVNHGCGGGVWAVWVGGWAACAYGWMCVGGWVVVVVVAAVLVVVLWALVSALALVLALAMATMVMAARHPAHPTTTACANPHNTKLNHVEAI